MDTLKRAGLALALILPGLFTFAQQLNNSKDAPADFMRSNGKLYVVVAVVVTIVTGIFLYLLNLDRKITKLEKKANT